MSNFIRNGDVNLHPITKEDFEKVRGEIIKNNGQFVLAEGEATGSKHLLTVERPQDLIIKKDADGRMYFHLKSRGSITHTHDHAPLITEHQYFVQVPEREVNWFAEGVIRKVVD